jgi:hypothetical protein
MDKQIMTKPKSLFEKFNEASTGGEPQSGGMLQKNGPDGTGGDPQSNGMLDETSNDRGPAPFNWAANIRGRTYPLPGEGSLIRITELGKRGAIPPIRIL